MKTLIGILGTLVIILGGILLFFIFNEKEHEEVIKTTSVEEKQSVDSSEGYQFQNIESLEKAKTMDEAFERFFGNERLFDKTIYFYAGAFPKGADVRGDNEIYLPEGTYVWNDKEIVVEEEIRLYNRVRFNIEMKVGYDTRKEMIDFLHYIQHSGLTENELGDTYSIQMNVFQPTKPGMNRPESHQKWGISTEKVKVMDFSDKETLLGEIHRYGEFEGVNPSGMK